MNVSPKQLRCFMYVVALAFWGLFAFVLLEKFDSSIARNVVRRKPAEHFFFDLLSGFDSSPSSSNYVPIPRTASSTAFTGIMDRVLLSQYLVRRFAYTKFLEVGCSFDHIHSLLPDSVTVRECVDHTNSLAFFNGNLSKFGLIVLEGRSVGALEVQQASVLLEAALRALDDSGTLLLTDTNPSLPSPDEPAPDTPRHSLWSLALTLIGREGMDSATLDCDGGITIIKSVVSADSRLNSPQDASKPVPTPVSSWRDVTSPDQRDKLLRLMSFEEIHNWLAPTGNVDALTAFGGEAAFLSWKDNQVARRRCSAMLSARKTPSVGGGVSVGGKTVVSHRLGHGHVSSDSSAAAGGGGGDALNCFHELHVSGKASLKARAQLALLLLEEGRLVDAVTLMGELQSVAPAWNRWVWKEVSVSTARTFDLQSPPGAPWKVDSVSAPAAAASSA